MQCLTVVRTQKSLKIQNKNKNYTAKIWAIRKRGGDFIVLGDNVDDALLDEVHFISHSPLPNYIIPRLKDFEF